MLLNQREKGNDLRTGTREYILAHPRERTPVRKSFYDHIVGFLHFIQNEGGTPRLALARDEYTANGNVPLILDVREGRRFRGRTRLTEIDVNPFLAGPGQRPPLQAGSIAIGDWAIERRPCSNERDPATGAYDGAILARALRAPYQVPFGCLLPEGIDNLLVTTTVSASHVAFCALRIEAVWTATGTAAGLAAAAAFRSGCRVADVPVAWLQDQMLQRGNKLTYFSDLASDHRDMRNILLALALLALGTPTGNVQTRDRIKIGGLSDMGGAMSDYAGPRSVQAARLAVQEFMRTDGSWVLPRPSTS